MSTSRIPSSATDTARPGMRAKTVATRLSPEELQEVENAAERDGKSLAEWLRELALRSARERPADPIELLFAELMAARYALLSLFHATALAGGEGKQLLADSVLKIRDTLELDWLSNDNRASLSDGKDECTPAIRNRGADGYPERVHVAALEYHWQKRWGARRSRDGVRGRDGVFRLLRNTNLTKK